MRLDLLIDITIRVVALNVAGFAVWYIVREWKKERGDVK